MERKTYKNVIENKKCVTFALAEIMAEKPFYEISVTEVCKKAGVSKNTFYRHFENLSDVVFQTATEINNMALEKNRSIKSKKLSDYIKAGTEIWYEHRKIYGGFIQDETLYIVQNVFRKGLGAFFYDYISDNGEDNLFVEYFSAVLCVFLKWWSRNNFAPSPEEMSERITDYFSGEVSGKLEKYL